MKKRICNLPKDSNGKCSHLWGSDCNYKCCIECSDTNCNSRCGFSHKSIFKNEDIIIWKMTRAEYSKEGKARGEKEYKKKLELWNRQSKEYKSLNELISPEKNKQWIINCYISECLYDHKEAVMKAYKEGKDIPQKVLEEYKLKK
jgi:hypothetical protein